MNWPPYPDYRESGVQWLGDVPSSWEVSPLKYVATVFPSNVDKHTHDGEISVRLCNYTDVYYNDRISGALEFMQATATEDEIKKFTLRGGDTIITKDSETADDIGLSAYVENSLPGVLCGYHLSVVRPSVHLNGRFVKRLFDSRYLKALMEINANGLTRVGLGQYAIDNLDIPHPPVGEQAQIANFLDGETAKIDALIAKQEQLIATLREDRTATITHAVTKGLDPGVEKRNTGSDWLSELPCDWSITRLKWMASLITSGSRGWAQYYADNGDYFVRIGNLRRGSLGFDDSDVNYVQIPPGVEGSRTITREGDLLFSITAYLGSVAVVDGPHSGGYVSQHVSLVRLLVEQLNPAYAGYTTLSEVGQRQLKENAYGGTKIQLSLDDIADLELPLPPVAEQRRIVEFLDERCDRIDTLIAKATEVIDTLREYRSALITDAVTGKIDVRDAA
jgi:type I restriction enzyme S subunit